jgi:hypothetical protein
MAENRPEKIISFLQWRHLNSKVCETWHVCTLHIEVGGRSLIVWFNLYLSGFYSELGRESVISYKTIALSIIL